MPRIPLTRGLFAVVDARDFKHLSKFRWQAHGSAEGGRIEPVRHLRAVRVNGAWRSQSITMAQEIMGIRTGQIVDHRNRNPLDCRRSNMRWATRSQNAINWRRRNALGVRGVSRNGTGYTARIKHAGQRICLGTYPELAQAKEAYRRAALAMHGKFAVLEAA